MNYKLWLGVIVTIVCLGLALGRLDWSRVVDSFRRADYRSTLPTYLAMMFVFFWLKAIRWRMLLEPVGAFTSRQVTPAMMIGFAFNNILPAHLGEFVRMYVLGRQFQISKTAVLSSIVLERVFDIVAVLALFAVGLYAVPGLPDSMKTVAYVMLAMLVAGILVLLTYIFFTAAFVRIVESLLNRFSFIPDSVRTMAAEMMEAGARGLESIKNVRLMTGIVITSLVQWAANGVMVYVSLRAFGIDVGIYASFIVLAAVVFAIIIPSTPGYVGVIQLMFQWSLEPLGVDPTDAFAAATYFQIAQWFPVTGIGLWFFYRSGIRYSEVRAGAATEHTAVETTIASSTADGA